MEGCRAAASFGPCESFAFLPNGFLGVRREPRAGHVFLGGDVPVRLFETNLRAYDVCKPPPPRTLDNPRGARVGPQSPRTLYHTMPKPIKALARDPADSHGTRCSSRIQIFTPVPSGFRSLSLSFVPCEVLFDEFFVGH